MIFPHLRAVDSKVLVGVVCSLCVQMCWCTALGPTAVCNLPLGVSISIWPIDPACIYSKLSSLGLLTTSSAWIPGFLVKLHSRWESIPPSQSWGVGLQFCTGYSGKSPSVNVLTAVIRAGRRRILNLLCYSTMK